MISEDKVAAGHLDGEIRKWISPMLLGLPGFLSIGLARYLGEMGDLSEFELTTCSLALSLPIFIGSGLIYQFLRKIRRRNRQDHIKIVPPLSWGFALVVLMVSLILGTFL